MACSASGAKALGWKGMTVMAGTPAVIHVCMAWIMGWMSELMPVSRRTS